MDVDADRKRPDAYPPVVLGMNLIMVGFDPEQPSTEGNEVLGPDRPLESDEIRSEHAAQDLLPPWHPHEEFLGRERDVQEESDHQVRAYLAEHRRDQEQVVVVDPRCRPRRGRSRGSRGEAAVHLAIRDPAVGVESGLADRVVEQRPERAVRDAFVVMGELIARQRHRYEVGAVYFLDGGEREVVLGLVELAVPADPGSGP